MKLWSDKCQVYFVPNRTMVMIRSQQQTETRSQNLVFMDSVETNSAPKIKIVGANVDKKLTFISQVRGQAGCASRKFSSIQRISSLLYHK